MRGGAAREVTFRVVSAHSQLRDLPPRMVWRKERRVDWLRLLDQRALKSTARRLPFEFSDLIWIKGETR
jgi:hypothetical protein